ncbi:MAG: GNAT family N-acetyltransferase [Steroidobacteraceae bacterium]
MTSTAKDNVLRTERLTLRQLDMADAEFILELLTDADFKRYIGDRGVTDLASARRYINEGPRASYARFGFGLLRVGLAEDDRAIGICGLLQRDTLPDPDIGFAFLPAWRRSGYALEAARAVLDWGQRERAMRRILAIVTPENERSIRLLERLGLHHESETEADASGKRLKIFALS